MSFDCRVNELCRVASLGIAQPSFLFARGKDIFRVEANITIETIDWACCFHAPLCSFS